MDRIEVHLSKSYTIILWIVGVFTLGVGALGMWFSARSWPKIVDSAGMILRNGKQVKWNEITNIEKVCVVDSLGRRVTGRLELTFGDTVVKVVPQSLAEGADLMAFISKMLGEEVRTG